MADEEVEVFKALANDKRWKIIKSLSAGEKGSRSLLEEVDLSQSTLSHHLSILIDCGLVDCRKEGKWMYYFLSPPGFQPLFQSIKELESAFPKG